MNYLKIAQHYDEYKKVKFINHDILHNGMNSCEYALNLFKDIFIKKCA